MDNSSSMLFKRRHWLMRSVFRVSLIILGLSLTLFVFIPFIIAFSWPFHSDWSNVFRPAFFAILSGESPYTIGLFANPPWTLLFLAPFLLLSEDIGFIAFVIFSIGTWIFVLKKLGATPFVIVLMMLTPQLWWSIVYGNIDVLVALGLIFPPQIGLFFVLIKPQIGIGVAVFWFFETLQQGKIKETIRVFGPLVIASILSIILFPSLISSRSTFYSGITDGNLAHFPYLVPVGILLIYRAIKSRNVNLSISSGVFLTPYLGVNSLSIPVLGLLPSEVETIIAIVCLWFIWILRGTT